MSKLVIKKWHLVDLETSTDEVIVDIAGRSSGIISWLMSKIGVDPTENFTATREGISFRPSSLTGTDMRFVPYECVSSVAWGYFKPLWRALVCFLAATIIAAFIAWLLINELQSGGKVSDFGQFLAVVIGVVVGAVVAGWYYHFNRMLTIQFTEVAGHQFRIQFKASFIEGLEVSERQAERVYQTVRELMRQRSAGIARRGALTPPSPPLHPAPRNPVPPPLGNGGAMPLHAPSDDGEVRASGLYHAAKELAKNGNRQAAVDALREIIRDHPTTRAAEKARTALKGH